MEVYILQGAPGCGKSTVTNNLYNSCEKGDAVVCSADDYFTQTDGVYRFNAAKLFLAHKMCQDLFVRSIESKKKVIIVDNTNTTLSEVKTYYDLLKDNIYTFTIVRPDTSWYFNAEECFKRNVHGVPLDKIEIMIERIKNFSLGDIRGDIRWI